MYKRQAVGIAGAQRLVDGPLDIIVGHIGRLGLGNDGGQTGVVGGITAAPGLDCYDHFTGNLGKNLGALGVGRTLGLLYIVPLGMSGHGNIVPFLCNERKYYITLYRP